MRFWFAGRVRAGQHQRTSETREDLSRATRQAGRLATTRHRAAAHIHRTSWQHRARAYDWGPSYLTLPYGGPSGRGARRGPSPPLMRRRGQYHHAGTFARRRVKQTQSHLPTARPRGLKHRSGAVTSTTAGPLSSIRSDAVVPPSLVLGPRAQRPGSSVARIYGLGRFQTQQRGKPALASLAWELLGSQYL